MGQVEPQKRNESVFVFFSPAPAPPPFSARLLLTMPPVRPSRSPPPTLASTLARGAAGAAAGFAGVSALVCLLAASGGRRDQPVSEREKAGVRA